jgi:hypothetical protein
MTFTILAIRQRATWTRQTPVRYAALEPRLAPDAEAEQMTNGCVWRADPVSESCAGRLANVGAAGSSKYWYYIDVMRVHCDCRLRLPGLLDA